jgi:hypothetical protein
VGGAFLGLPKAKKVFRSFRKERSIAGRSMGCPGFEYKNANTQLAAGTINGNRNLIKRIFYVLNKSLMKYS